MIEKFKRKKIDKQDITKPKSVDDLFIKHNSDHNEILNYLDYMVDNIENEFSSHYNLNLGQNLDAGTNLNDVMTPGTYYSENATKTASLVNAPITNAGFRLIVEYISGTNRIKQTIYVNANSPITYSRMYTNTWQSWVKAFEVIEITKTCTTGSTAHHGYYYVDLNMRSDGININNLIHINAKTGGNALFLYQWISDNEIRIRTNTPNTNVTLYLFYIV